MWKEPANHWGSKKNPSTGGVMKCGLFSTWKIVDKNIPQVLFHMSPKSGGKVKYILQSEREENRQVLSLEREQKLVLWYVRQYKIPQFYSD